MIVRSTVPRIQTCASSTRFVDTHHCYFSAMGKRYLYIAICLLGSVVYLKLKNKNRYFEMPIMHVLLMSVFCLPV